MAGSDDNLFSYAQREEIREIVRKTIIEVGLDANGSETRAKNIQRMQFIDWAMYKFNNLSVNVGRAVTFAIVTALLGLVWLGFKTKILS